MNFKKIILFLVVSAFFCAGNTLALEKAVFPNQVKMQPIPEGVVPNISGNVNWHTNPSISNENLGSFNNQPLGNISGKNNAGGFQGDKSITKKIFNTNVFWWIIIFILIFVFFAYLFSLATKKRKLLENQ